MNDAQALVGRFAPSPSGRMHAGNIFAALMTWLIVKSQGGRIVLRIEDLDQSRSQKKWADLIQHDFELLGLTWDEGPYFQNDHLDVYQKAFGRLLDTCYVYPCFCTRADLHIASAPHEGEMYVYSGRCRRLNESEIAARKQNHLPSWRIEVPDKDYNVEDIIQGTHRCNLATSCGDSILKRADGIFSYQLTCVCDDARQGINCIVRGVDLLSSTPLQIFLQERLGFERPCYAHVPLLVNSEHKRLSKRDKDAQFDELLDRFKLPEHLIGHLAALSGLIDHEEALSCSELLQDFRLDELQNRLVDKKSLIWR